MDSLVPGTEKHMLGFQSILDVCLGRWVEGWVGGCHMVIQIKDCSRKRTKLFPIIHPREDIMKQVTFDLVLEGWGREGFLEISKDQRAHT